MFPTFPSVAAAAVVLALLPIAALGKGGCADCHGKDGASSESDVPSIGGLSEQYILDSMGAYRDRKRPCPESRYRAGDTRRPKTDMCQVAIKLGAEGATAEAREYAARPFVKARQKFDAAKAAVGKKIHDQACEKCHSEGGTLAEDDAGVLAGQWLPYLEASFAEFAGGTRPMPEKMKPKFDPLKPEEREALLHYYASQQ